jgi:hypothetical protein
VTTNRRQSSVPNRRMLVLGRAKSLQSSQVQFDSFTIQILPCEVLVLRRCVQCTIDKEVPRWLEMRREERLRAFKSLARKHTCPYDESSS